MTTDQGLMRPNDVRWRIETLRERANYLAEKLLKIAEEKGPDWDMKGTYAWQEIRALTFAIELMEVEFNTASRIRRNCMKFETRLAAVERHGKAQDDFKRQPKWELPESAVLPKSGAV